MKTIVDTGPLVAYFCAADQYHAWSVATLDTADFRAYRRHDRKVIPYVAPPPTP